MKGLFALSLVLISFVLFGCAGQTPSEANQQAASGMAINTSAKINGVSVLPAATSGQPYNVKMTVTGGEPPYNCSATEGTTLPGNLVFSEPGCSLSGSAPILPSGTTTKMFPISFIVRDSNETVGGPFQLSLVVNLPAPKLSLPEKIGTAETESPYAYNFCEAASQDKLGCNKIALGGSISGTPPYSFTASGQPLGISMGMNGMLSGTVPKGANAGNYKITVCVSDLTGTQACADTSLEVVEKQEEAKPKETQLSCPADGNWKGIVSAVGVADMIGSPGKTEPYYVKYDLEITLKCDVAYLDESGAKWWQYNITYAKASDPFFGCTGGCVPIAGEEGLRLTYLSITEGSQKGRMAIRFPNNALLQRTDTVMSRDGKMILDDVRPQAELGGIEGMEDAMATGSVGWNRQTGAKIEVKGCSGNCPNAYPQRETMELVKVG